MKIITFKDYLDGLVHGDVENYFKEITDFSSIAVISNAIMQRMSRASEQFKVIDDINDMVFGQFVAGEIAITAGLEDANMVKMLATTVIRPIEDEEFDNTDKEKEERHVSSIMEAPFTTINEEIKRYAEIRKQYVHVTFNGVFYKLYDEDYEPDEDEDDDSADAESDFVKNWYWYAIQKRLAGGDIFKMDDVLMLKMGRVAPDLAYERQMEMIETARRKRQEQINRMR